MGQRADGKYGGVDGESYTKFGEKTSQHGHWEVGASFGGTNADGKKWQNQRMEWVEDNRSFNAPSSESKSNKNDEVIPQDGNAWDIDYRDLRAEGNNSSNSTPVKDPQELVDQYTSTISGGKSNFDTGIQPTTANLNTEVPYMNATSDTNTFGEEADTSANQIAAQTFLEDKKLKLGSGLNLR